MLHFICFKSNLYRPPHSGYVDILNFLNLKSLKDRRNPTYTTLLIKLLNNKINDSSHFNNINFEINNHKL